MPPVSLTCGQDVTARLPSVVTHDIEPHRSLTTALRPDRWGRSGRAGPGPGRRRGRAGRLPRPQRRRQVDQPADADHAARRRPRQRDRGRLRHRAPTRPASGAGSATSARATAPATPSGSRDELVSQGRALRAAPRRGPRRGPTSCSTRWSCRALADRKVQHALRRPAPPARRRARAWCTGPGCCSWTSRRPGSTRRAGPTCGSTSCGCAAEHGMTVFLTTHYLDEADTMAERVMVMDHGRVIADDTADRAEGKLVGERIVVRAATAGRRGPAGRGGRDRGVRRRRRRHDDDRRGSRTDRPRCPACCGARARRRGRDRRGPPGHPRRRLPGPDRPQPARERHVRRRATREPDR